jgi:hypothetical protein
LRGRGGGERKTEGRCECAVRVIALPHFLHHAQILSGLMKAINRREREGERGERERAKVNLETDRLWACMCVTSGAIYSSNLLTFVCLGWIKAPGNNCEKIERDKGKDNSAE